MSGTNLENNQMQQAEVTSSGKKVVSITEAAKITTDKNEVTYEAEVGKDGKSWDVLFNEKGKFLKQEEGD